MQLCNVKIVSGRSTSVELGLLFYPLHVDSSNLPLTGINSNERVPNAIPLKDSKFILSEEMNRQTTRDIPGSGLTVIMNPSSLFSLDTPHRQKVFNKKHLYFYLHVCIMKH